jgi:predicted nucleic acid-binding Zn ribbon protein
MKDEALKLCPECGGEIHRLINGGAGVIYKGGGFYCTDKGLPRSGKNTQAPAASEKKPAPAPCAACKKAESGACGAA